MRPHRRKMTASSGKISSSLKKHFESLVTTRISIVLQMMYAHPDELVDLESGEKYICSVCDREYKRCEVELDYRCEVARKLETEFKELELALSRLRGGNYGFCERCYKFIGKEELERMLTRTVCDSCGGLS
ncbi:MAG TPA: hypothetical protein VLX91_03705 [Candidatus Acidoferrales bacterium]|nr:hypothetical protein [Candidatus Acidoferrales bacterium]